jgi:microsomal dipeptidase-like Zn-dependent dipeptidase
VIIDGHNDLVLHRWRGEPTLHMDLDAARDAGFAGGFFALYVPSPHAEPEETPYSMPMPEPISHDEAAAIAEELFATLCELPVGRASSVDDFREGEVTAIVHLEGRACNRLGVVVDLSHLNEAGFWDVQRLSDAPLVATHSNAHALCPASRNLTDGQLDAIRESGGIVGVNFAVTFLREDGLNEPATPITEIVRHVDYLAERMGIEHVGLGSDFDGATIPDELGGAAGLPTLVAALRAAGYDDDAVAKITHANWLRVLGETWQ